MQEKEQKKKEAAKREAEILEWGWKQSNSEPGKPCVYSPEDTILNIENTEMDPPSTKDQEQTEDQPEDK